jgi:hypothetical protein
MPVGVFGKPTVRRAQLPGGNRMTEKRMPVAETQRETMGAGPVSNWSSWITGRIRGPWWPGLKGR